MSVSPVANCVAVQVEASKEPPTCRSCPMATMIGDQLLTFGGDSAAEAIQEICLADIKNLPGPLAWREPKVEGGLQAVPSARKGMAGVKKGNIVYLFSGMTFSEKHGYVGSDEMLAASVAEDTFNFTPIEQKGAFLPEFRAGATLRDHGKDSLLLLGGFDAAGKQLFDAWTFTVSTSTWTCVFNGHSDLAAPAGLISVLPGGKLATVNAAPGSTKLDVVASLDFTAAKADQEFVTKMKASGAEMLAELQRWTEEQVGFRPSRCFGDSLCPVLLLFCILCCPWRLNSAIRGVFAYYVLLSACIPLQVS